MVLLNPYKNSQKRIYVESGVYFITVNTFERYPFFKDEVFCNLFIEELKICEKLKGFKTLAYKLNPNHFHLLIQPSSEVNHSEILRSLKTNFSRNVNYIMGFVEKAGSRDPAFSTNLLLKEHFDKVEKNKTKYQSTYIKQLELSKFQWQASFHDHLVRDKNDLFTHVKYIENQWLKHDLPENMFCEINNSIIKEVVNEF